MSHCLIGYYSEISKDYILEENTRYILSFDYVVNSNTFPLRVSLGYGSTSTGKPNYSTDMKGITNNDKYETIEKYYPTDSKDGNITYIFNTTSFNAAYTPYFSIRLGRMSSPGQFDIDISNFRFKKAPDDFQPNNSVYSEKFSLQATGRHYQEYYTKVLLEPDTKYTVTFDYEVLSSSGTLGCGIGYGKSRTKNSPFSGGSYIKDIASLVYYPNQKKGSFSYTFTTPHTFTLEQPYLSLRPARMTSAGNFNVNFSNLIVKKTN